LKSGDPRRDENENERLCSYMYKWNKEGNRSGEIERKRVEKEGGDR
jgi:hypothetical protein